MGKKEMAKEAVLGAVKEDYRHGRVSILAWASEG